MPDIVHDPELVSVILPTYNRRDLVRRAIDSALAQTYPKTELVVVDDGSTDGTREALEPLAGEGRITYLFQPNSGVAAARNRGMHEARGGLLAFLDSDDVWQPWKLAVQTAVIRSMPEVALVCSDFAAVTPDGLQQSYIRSYYPVLDRLGVDYASLFENSAALSEFVRPPTGTAGQATVHWGRVGRWVFSGNFIHTSTVLVYRHIALSLGGFEESFHTQEDADLYLRIALRHPIALVDLPTCVYSTLSEDRLTDDSRMLEVNEAAYRILERAVTEAPWLESRHGSLVRRRFADKARAVGLCHLRSGETKLARRWLLRSMGHDLSLLGAVALCACVVPLGVVDFSRRIVRAVRPANRGPRARVARS